MKFNLKTTVINQKKAHQILESADIEGSDSISLDVLNCVLTEKESLLAHCQPKAQNYESVLSEKLWKIIEAEKSRSQGAVRTKSQKRFWSIFQTFSMQLSIVLALGAVVWTAYKLSNTNGFKELESSAPFLAALSDVKGQGASNDELDIWLASVSDGDTRYVLTAQDLGGLSRSLDKVSDNKDFESIINEVVGAIGADL